MTDTNSKAQVTEKMVNAADSVLSRSRPGIPDEIIALAISAALAAQEKPEPGVAVKAEKPFMYGIMEPDGTAYMDEVCVDLSGDTLKELIEEDEMTGYTVVPLYLHPALVSTQAQAGEPGLSAMRVIDPDQWEPCSPSYLNRGGDCASAPRVWDAVDKNHWHPKLVAPSPDLPEGEVKEPRKDWRGGPMFWRCALMKFPTDPPVYAAVNMEMSVPSDGDQQRYDKFVLWENGDATKWARGVIQFAVNGNDQPDWEFVRSVPSSEGFYPRKLKEVFPEIVADQKADPTSPSPI